MTCTQSCFSNTFVQSCIFMHEINMLSRKVLYNIFFFRFQKSSIVVTLAHCQNVPYNVQKLIKVYQAVNIYPFWVLKRQKILCGLKFHGYFELYCNLDHVTTRNGYIWNLGKFTKLGIINSLFLTLFSSNNNFNAYHFLHLLVFHNFHLGHDVYQKPIPCVRVRTPIARL